MYLLDTNHCSRLLMNDVQVLQQVATVQIAQIATCAVVQGELEYMVQNSRDRERNRFMLDQLLKGMYIYSITSETASIYGDLKAAVIKRFGPKNKAKRQTVRLQELGMGENDLWIAAVALQHNAILVSSDSDFQRLQDICSLAVESWWRPE